MIGISRVTFALVSALALLACSDDEPDCESLCKDYVLHKCCDEQDLGELCIDDADDCQKACETTKQLAEDSGCEKQLDAGDACAAKLDDICEDSSTCVSTGSGEFSCDGGGCDEEFEDWLGCFTAFCNEHPENNGC